MLLFNHMGMLTREDIKLIGVEVGNVIEQNVTPQLEDIRGRLDRVETRLDRVETRLDRVDGKVNSLINVLQEKKVITDADKRVVLS